MRLKVLQFGELIGWLESTADRGVIFRYDESALSRPETRPLSASLPLRGREYPQSQAVPFFAGLLPDGELRRRIADYLHISETSTLRLLEALGGECAGTVSLVRDDPESEGIESEVGKPWYEEIPHEELEAMIREADRRPLLLPSGDARLSLAGAQEKIPLLLKEGRWYRPRGGAPSSHILKPGSSAYPDIVSNEFASMRLAAELGLTVAQVDMIQLGRPVLVVRRYDRTESQNGSIARIHQEDMCQALGIMPDGKYEADGGPGFADIARLVRTLCVDPLADLEALIDNAIFNVLLGNCDAHGKNLSILYRESGAGLAPFYDLVATTVWPELSTRLSMRFGTEYKLEKLRSDDLDAFAKEIGVKPALVLSHARKLAEAAEAAWRAIRELIPLANAQDLIDRMEKGWDSRANRLGFKE